MKNDLNPSFRATHREDPKAFFQQIMTAYWSDREPDQTEAKWRKYCLTNRWYAEDVLECFATILADPPQNLADIMQEFGSIMLPHGNAPYTVLWYYRQQYVDWLKQTDQRFREIFAETAN